MKIKLEDGTRYKPKADDSVVCEDHNVTVRWGDLDAIQQLAVSEGIDTVKDSRCILLRRDAA